MPKDSLAAGQHASCSSRQPQELRWRGNALLVVGAVLLRCSGVDGSGGITDDERLLRSNGSWHRAQRKSIAFETSCYYTQNPDLPNGCQAKVAREPAWRNNTQRTAERSALLDLFNQAGGAQWRVNDNWSKDSDPCWDNWYGVTCNENGYVIGLDLSDNGLRGVLPPSLGHLTQLLRLDVSTSAPEYHSHPNVYANRLRNVLPSLARLSRLEEIEVSGNDLSEWPTDFGVLGPTLRSLGASHNKFRYLPPNLGNFSALHTLELAHNSIAGEIPSEFGNMGNLRVVQLQYNLLSGAIPPAVVRLEKIRIFDVSHNRDLGGEIPKSILEAWTSQDYLSVFNTSVTGYIASLCSDVPFCWRYMYATHKDLTWATADGVPEIVNITLQRALAGGS